MFDTGDEAGVVVGASVGFGTEGKDGIGGLGVRNGVGCGVEGEDEVAKEGKEECDEDDSTEVLHEEIIVIFVFERYL